MTKLNATHQRDLRHGQLCLDVLEHEHYSVFLDADLHTLRCMYHAAIGDGAPSALTRDQMLSVIANRQIDEAAELLQLKHECPFCRDSAMNAAGFEASRLLRWSKALRGFPITYSFEPDMPTRLRDAATSSFNMWKAAVPRLRFLQREDGDSGDIVFRVAYIDGFGGTLGITFMPATGDEMDVALWSGDIQLDSESFGWSVRAAKTIVAHEVGHAIGLDHNDSRSSLMYPGYIRNYSALQQTDNAVIEAQRLYPTLTEPHEEPNGDLCEASVRAQP